MQQCIQPAAVAADGAGNVYIADRANNEVEKVTPSGALSVIAGNGVRDWSIPGQATSSPLNDPNGVAVDANGNVYISDSGNNRIEKVTPGGILSTVAGNGSAGKPVAGLATNSSIYDPYGVAVDGSGNLYIADYGNNLVEKVTPNGILSVIAGNGSMNAPVAGPALNSPLWFPFGLAVDSSGNVYVTSASTVARITPGGTLSIAAGNGNGGVPTAGTATKSPLNPLALAIDLAGNLYITDSTNRVEKVTPGGTLSIVAGAGYAGPPQAGPATSSGLNDPYGVAVSPSGTLYIADELNSRVEAVDSTGQLSIFAGNGSWGWPQAGAATNSFLHNPHGVAVDAAGNTYIADTANNVVEKVTSAGVLSIVAGNGLSGPSWAGSATNSPLNKPGGVAVDASGNFYIADTGNNRVEKVTPSGTLSIVAGTGSAAMTTPGTATASALDQPDGVAVDTAGDIFIADTGNNLIEKVTPGGTLSTVAGTGQASAPIPGAATSSPLNGPQGVAVDTAGNIYIADTGNLRVEKVTASGVLSTVAGTGSWGGTSIPGVATSVSFGTVNGVAVDGSGNFYVADGFSNTIDKVNSSGQISLVAGQFYYGPPTPGAATSSNLSNPLGLAVDSAGNIYIADTNNNDVEKVVAP